MGGTYVIPVGGSLVVSSESIRQPVFIVQDVWSYSTEDQLIISLYQDEITAIQTFSIFVYPTVMQSSVVYFGDFWIEINTEVIYKVPLTSMNPSFSCNFNPSLGIPNTDPVNLYCTPNYTVAIRWVVNLIGLLISS